MIVYQATKAGFLRDAFESDIENIILASYRQRTGHSVGRNEFRSWKESLIAVAKVVYGSVIPDDCGVGIEYGIPQTSKRIDFLLTGRDDDSRPELVIIELKQWERAEPTRMDGVVRTRFEKGPGEVSHPSYQAWSYAQLLGDFNESVEAEAINLRPCAYLHNFIDDGSITSSFYKAHLDRAPVFLKGDDERNRLRAFIGRHLRTGDRGQLLYAIENGRIRPSRSLVECLESMLRGKREFVLVDDQKVVFETIVDVAQGASSANKQVLIVEGGPGTGKSVVAINALVALTSMQQVARYVTKNAAPRAVFESKLSGSMTKSRIANMFTGSGSFTDTPADVFDTLVVDEAHRVTEKSGLYGNLGTHQVDELIASSKCAVFFIDEDQRVTWKDVGSKDDIERRARRAGADVTHLQLASQFRCNGSDGYLAWLDNTLGIRPTANPSLAGIDYDFRVFDSPVELRHCIEEKDRLGARARLVAGYCWDWKSKRDPASMDVVLPEFGLEMQWNLTDDGSLWIIAPNSIKQIGCIHTCQGLEVDYIGVIVGPDLALAGDCLVTRPEARSRHDKSIHGYKAELRSDPVAAKSKADRIIRNTYRTLMTRGMKGCYVFCTDAPMRDYLQRAIRGVAADGSPDND